MTAPVMMDSMTTPVHLDALDQGLMQALMIDGRAPFSRIAEVLEVSDQTVVRRYRRLRTSGLIRVVGLPLGSRVGLFESWLRVQCAPDAALAVAEALARRPDISWVKLGSGGTEINCLTKARTRQDRDGLLLDKLPRTRRVTGVSAHTILRVYIGGPTQWCGLDTLRPEQVAALTRPPRRPDRSGTPWTRPSSGCWRCSPRTAGPAIPSWPAPPACRSPPRAAGWTGCGS